MKTLEEIKRSNRIIIGNIGIDGGIGEITMPGWRGTVIMYLIAKYSIYEEGKHENSRSKSRN